MRQCRYSRISPLTRSHRRTWWTGDLARAGMRRRGAAWPPSGARRVRNHPEACAFRLRDPEQLADHRERHRERVPGHQVDDPLAHRQVVEQAAHDRADPFLQSVHPPSGERRGHHPAQPGVVGRVDGEHVPGQRRAGRMPPRRPRRCGPARLCMSLDRRGSASAAWASSWATISQAACPSASRTSCTGPVAGTRANNGTGSFRS